ncbi:hypothetical protein M2336_002399 [Sphingobium sp. B1D7B]|uniref:beta-1,6-N-acetylglucosaminyltransferase n=1 Tax=unclassified Sphingobium TaxID=2611147 RepID=UPI002224E8E6|nr:MULTISPECIES: beta-1,6-N-acetylglucosaminyltransferase [unclassified Sphingobium]MCW2390629.1 hypothetical protein [Sphingobium sp. B11D3A]MCW2405770.1 hypothetical protein [Sphingobium sp. B1D7B]
MHAVVITAYKDFPTLERMVRRLDRAFFRVIIHVDKRSRISNDQLERLTALGCHCQRTYRVRWGSVTHLYAILDLLKIAVKYDDCDYVHLVSGQDYPIATVEDFQTKCDGRIFMKYEPLEISPDHVAERYRHYNIFYFLQGGPPFSGSLHKYLDRLFAWGQKRLKISRNKIMPFEKIFVGTVWMSLPHSAARKIVEDRKAQVFLNGAKRTYLAEEIYFQTYFLNSSFRTSTVNNDLRFTDWSFRNGSVPAYLDENDVQAAIASGALFARKVSSDTSLKFMQRIDEVVFGKH